MWVGLFVAIFFSRSVSRFDYGKIFVFTSVTRCAIASNGARLDWVCKNNGYPPIHPPKRETEKIQKIYCSQTRTHAKSHTYTQKLSYLSARKAVRRFGNDNAQHTCCMF